MPDFVTVIARNEDEEAGVDDPRIVMTTRFIRVRRSEVAEPAPGDVIEPQESGGRFRVKGSPRIDRKGIWRCEVIEE